MSSSYDSNQVWVDANGNRHYGPRENPSANNTIYLGKLPNTTASTPMNLNVGAASGGQTVGQYGATGGGSTSDFVNRFSNPTASTGGGGPKTWAEMTPTERGESGIASGIGAAGQALASGFQQQAQNAQQAAKNIGNIKSSIPGPDEFKYQENTQLKQNPYV